MDAISALPKIAGAAVKKISTTRPNEKKKTDKSREQLKQGKV